MNEGRSSRVEPAAPIAMSKEKTNKLLVPVILAFVAFGFYVLSIVMQFLSAGAAT